MYIDRCKFMAEVTRQNLTFRELCQKTGFTYAVMTKLKKNGGPCAEETLQKICDVLGVRIVDLLDDEAAWKAYEAKLQEAEAIKPHAITAKRMNSKQGYTGESSIHNIKFST